MKGHSGASALPPAALLPACLVDQLTAETRLCCMSVPMYLQAAFGADTFTVTVLNPSNSRKQSSDTSNHRQLQVQKCRPFLPEYKRSWWLHCAKQHSWLMLSQRSRYHRNLTIS